MPASSRVSEANPGAAISSRKPKWSTRNALDARTSSTLSDTADDVIRTGPPRVLYTVRRTAYFDAVADARTGRGDPARTIALLWRDPAVVPRRGPARGRDLDAVVSAAVALADDGGLSAVTIRAV